MNSTKQRPTRDPDAGSAAGQIAPQRHGPRGHSGEVMIVVGSSRESLGRRFAGVERAGTVICRFCMPYESDKPVWIARGLRQPLAEIWGELKHYD